MPEDLCGFLETTDGMNVKWRAVNLQSEITVGHLSLNSVSGILKLDDAPDSGNSVAFALNYNPKVGTVALVFRRGSSVSP